MWFIMVMLLNSVNAQDNDSLPLNKGRLTKVLAIEASVYAGSMFALNELWYKGYERESFHLFNDNKEWLQVDKMGHAFSGYYLGLVGMQAMKWAGAKEKKSIWLGGSLGLVFLSTIEMFDGFSAEWGFSAGDMTANAAGYLLAASQQQLLGKQTVMLKFSVQGTSYAKARPNVLGSNFAERFMKDYNGHTYWLSVTLADIFKSAAYLPPWLAVSFGYGAKGMYGGFKNQWESNGVNYDFSNTRREREFYAALDINLWRIKTKNKTLQSLLKTIGFIKVPLPTYEFNSGRFYPVFF
jgi:hypothetical protein